MDVTVWAGSAKKQLGIRIGTQNRQQYFRPGWKEVEVEMDGYVHCFGLTSGFWHDCPEFRDRGQPLIRDWLSRHGLFDWKKGKPPTLVLVPLEGNRFRLLSK